MSNPQDEHRDANLESRQGEEQEQAPEKGSAKGNEKFGDLRVSKGTSVEKAARESKEKQQPNEDRIVLATHCGTFP